MWIIASVCSAPSFKSILEQQSSQILYVTDCLASSLLEPEDISLATASAFIPLSKEDKVRLYEPWLQSVRQ